MLDLIVYTILLGIGAVVLYAVYLIPPVKRVVRDFVRRNTGFLVVLGFALFVAAAMYFIILPRM